MLPSSHLDPMFAGVDRVPPLEQAATHLPRREAGLLADAFSAFIAASARLEASYRDLQGEVAQLGQELAERNAALEQSLDENRNMRHFLEQVLDSMPCGVVVLSTGDRIERMNPEACRLLGVGLDEARSLAALSGATGVNFAACSAVEGEQQLTLARASAPRWVEMRTRWLGAADRGGQTAQTIFILRDITLHKEAEQERETARRAMALAEIAATLAHEIRNPLASLELFGSLLADNAEPARTTEWVDHMRAGIRVLSGTVNNVLSFYGTGFPGLAPLAVSAPVAQAVEFVRPIAAQACVRLLFSALAREAQVLGSESALGQVVLNLVCNAVRYTLPGGWVTVTLTVPREGWIAMRCSDNGCGIPGEQLSQIFRPGFSGSGARSGLGLAVCRRIASEHGGALTVSSKVGQGTTFVMELPELELPELELPGPELPQQEGPGA